MNEVRCNITNQKIHTGMKSNLIPEHHKEKFLVFVAYEIARLAALAIDDQRYEGKWKSLNFYYKQGKEKQGYSGKIWQRTGTLKVAISADLVNGDMVIGIDPDEVYEDGTSVLKVARWMEFGTKRMESRPLFRPIIKYVGSNLEYFYNKFMTEGHLRLGIKNYQKTLDEIAFMRRVRMKKFKGGN